MNIAELSKKIIDNISRLLIGKQAQTELVLAAVFASGHILLEDVPGTGKTTLAKALARSMDVEVKRIQFTPDLLPADITGVDFFNMKNQEFTFHQGPIFSNIVIADEINRATPRTQSALLEAMQERQVTVGQKSYKLNAPFFVIATQNPIETKGTFPLPEAQTDRFAIKLSLGYPENDKELDILRIHKKGDLMTTLEPVCNAAQILAIQSAIEDITVSDAVAKYIVSLSNATRSDPRIRLGVSPRASLSLLKLCQAYAAIKGRDYVLPDDVKTMLIPCYSHRIISNSARSLDATASNEAILASIADSVKAPIE